MHARHCVLCSKMVPLSILRLIKILVGFTDLENHILFRAKKLSLRRKNIELETLEIYENHFISATN